MSHSVPIKAKALLTKGKQREMSLFNQKGLIYPNFRPWGTMEIFIYIIKALGKFLVFFKKKMLIMLAKGLFFNLDIPQALTATQGKSLSVARLYQIIEKWSFLPYFHTGRLIQVLECEKRPG